MSAIPIDCCTCQKKIESNAVLLLCDCLIALCKDCALRQLAHNPLSYRGGIYCPCCGKTSSTPENGLMRIEAAIEVENTLIRTAFTNCGIKPPALKSKKNARFDPQPYRKILAMYDEAIPLLFDYHSAAVMNLRLYVARYQAHGDIVPEATDMDSLALGPLEFIEITLDNTLHSILNGTELITKCDVCLESLKPGQSVLFNCFCSLKSFASCQSCARQSIANYESTFHDNKGVKCFLCKQRAIPMGGVEAALELEKSLLTTAKEAVHMGKQCIDRRTKMENLKELVEQFVLAHGIPSLVEIYSFEDGGGNRVESVDMFRLDLARMEAERQRRIAKGEYESMRDVRSIYPLGPLSRLIIPRNKFLDAYLINSRLNGEYDLSIHHELEELSTDAFGDWLSGQAVMINETSGCVPIFWDASALVKMVLAKCKRDGCPGDSLEVIDVENSTSASKIVVREGSVSCPKPGCSFDARSHLYLNIHLCTIHQDFPPCLPSIYDPSAAVELQGASVVPAKEDIEGDEHVPATIVEHGDGKHQATVYSKASASEIESVIEGEDSTYSSSSEETSDDENEMTASLKEPSLQPIDKVNKSARFVDSVRHILDDAEVKDGTEMNALGSVLTRTDLDRLRDKHIRNSEVRPAPPEISSSASVPIKSTHISMKSIQESLPESPPQYVEVIFCNQKLGKRILSNEPPSCYFPDEASLKMGVPKEIAPFRLKVVYPRGLLKFVGTEKILVHRNGSHTQHARPEFLRYVRNNNHEEICMQDNITLTSSNFTLSALNALLETFKYSFRGSITKRKGYLSATVRGAELSSSKSFSDYLIPSGSVVTINRKSEQELHDLSDKVKEEIHEDGKAPVIEEKHPNARHKDAAKPSQQQGNMNISKNTKWGAATKKAWDSFMRRQQTDGEVVDASKTEASQSISQVKPSSEYRSSENIIGSSHGDTGCIIGSSSTAVGGEVVAVSRAELHEGLKQLDSSVLQPIEDIYEAHADSDVSSSDDSDVVGHGRKRRKKANKLPALEHQHKRIAQSVTDDGQYAASNSSARLKNDINNDRNALETISRSDLNYNEDGRNYSRYNNNMHWHDRRSEHYRRRGDNSYRVHDERFGAVHQNYRRFNDKQFYDEINRNEQERSRGNNDRNNKINDDREQHYQCSWREDRNPSMKK